MQSSVLYFFFFDTGFYYAAQDGLKLFFKFIFNFIYYYCMCVCMVNWVYGTCRNQKTVLWSQVSPSIFMWVLGIELRSPGLWGRLSHLLSHLACPHICLQTQPLCHYITRKPLYEFFKFIKLSLFRLSRPLIFFVKIASATVIIITVIVVDFLRQASLELIG